MQDMIMQNQQCWVIFSRLTSYTLKKLLLATYMAQLTIQLHQYSISCVVQFFSEQFLESLNNFWHRILISPMILSMLLCCGVQRVSPVLQSVSPSHSSKFPSFIELLLRPFKSANSKLVCISCFLVSLYNPAS